MELQRVTPVAKGSCRLAAWRWFCKRPGIMSEIIMVCHRPPIYRIDQSSGERCCFVSFVIPYVTLSPVSWSLPHSDFFASQRFSRAFKRVAVIFRAGSHRGRLPGNSDVRLRPRATNANGVGAWRHYC